MIDLHIDGALARLTLDRPAARNAIPLAAWDRIAEAAGSVCESGARLLVIRGAGGSFCAGADLVEFGGHARDAASAAAFRMAMRHGIDALAALPMPTVAMVEGPCYGAGVALALACDLRFADPSARFAITPAKIGISYPQQDVSRLVQLVGRAAAARLLFTALPVDAAEALRLGLVDLIGGEAGIEAILASDGASVRALKRGIVLAAAGVREDEAQDRAFDRLLRSEQAAALLKGRK